MTRADLTPNLTPIPDHGQQPLGTEETPSPPPPRPRGRLIPFLITLATVALAVGFSPAIRGDYFAAAWTGDATVRAYVVTIAPEVAGRIVQLPVADNQYVHKGDLLMVVDPTNFAIAVRLAEAAVDQTKALAQSAE